ncbi:hypothetical protein BKG96_02685 [Rodentibacter caecimuris]|uniref:Uncharacterized protein n=1 Tax=Rodentibacter caecimuris TaxID=1796644 RepID=A0A1V3KNJ2_9PAST|nr:helix-turn-helix transcriptional regulator [Rodentibacter heylii]OOF79229.1 hypothetical protein BKG96_02685 [Rodentibacter heylii]
MDFLTILSNLFSGWFTKKLIKDKQIQHNINIENNIQITDKFDNPKNDNTEVSGIVKRLNQFKDLLNKNETYDIYTIAKLARIMEFKSVGELENIFKGVTEPGFEFIKKFCNTFGINEEWLTEGKREPFYLDKQTNYNPFHYYPYIKECNPIQIYFIRSDNSEPSGYTFIVLKFSDHKYEVIHRLWHIGSGVGSGGQSQIYGMYQLFKQLDRDKKLYRSGRVLNKDQFDLLYSGKIFPGCILKYPMENNMWWDDFTDVYNKFFSQKSYENMYGSGFISAQNVVKSYLEQEK